MMGYLILVMLCCSFVVGFSVGMTTECCQFAKDSASAKEFAFQVARPCIKATEASPEYIQWLKEHPNK